MLRVLAASFIYLHYIRLIHHFVFSLNSFWKEYASTRHVATRNNFRHCTFICLKCFMWPLLKVTLARRIHAQRLDAYRSSLLGVQDNSSHA